MHESHGQIQAFKCWHLNDIQMLAKSKSYMHSIIHSPWEILNAHIHVLNHTQKDIVMGHGLQTSSNIAITLSIMQIHSL